MKDFNIITQVLLPVLFAVGVFAGYFLRWFFAGKKLRETEDRIKTLVESAQKEADTRKKEAELQSKDLMIKLRQDFERETKDRREEALAIEKRLLQKEENLDKRVDLLEKKEKDINNRLAVLHENEDKIKKKTEELNKLIEEEKIRLQKISSMTEEDARKLLLSRVDEDLLQEKAQRVRKMEDEIRESADKKARQVI